MIAPALDTFRTMAADGVLVPMHVRIMGDQLTPVLAYRRLVAPDQREAPSFLFESVETGGRQGRYSILGARPSVEVVAYGHETTVTDHAAGTRATSRVANPLLKLAELESRRVAPASGLPNTFTGGWVGYAGYDTVRFLEPDKLPFVAAPRDDRALPDLHFAIYRTVVVFDHVDRVVHVVHLVDPSTGEPVETAYARGRRELLAVVEAIQEPRRRLAPGVVAIDVSRGGAAGASNFTPQAFMAAVERTKAYIAAGDAFQVVISQRFERITRADPFDVYRALRVVNPSPYMIYLQAAGSILVASSPEILCRVRDRVVVNRPLAGTRRRGDTPEQDAALERELLADAKERAEHIMLVDLARNDLGRVCEIGSVRVDRMMDVERYSHVMHISSTVTGRLRAGLTSWDALQATLPVGTVSGAPKVRAMQIIDEVEPHRRGPYGGGIGGVALDGSMDIALTLRTIVFPLAARTEDGMWTAHLQAGAGVVADSMPASEHQETVNKAAALGRAIDLAEAAFGDAAAPSPE